MPISKNRKNHKQKLNNFKQKTKINMSNQQLPPQMPPVRNIPTWPSDAKIELTGFEWEALQNALVQMQVAQQVGQAVMSRNIINGVISMDFEKLNPQTLQYEPMTEEEKAPHREELAKLIDGLKTSQETLTNPESTILNQDGEPATSDNVSNIITSTDAVA